MDGPRGPFAVPAVLTQDAEQPPHLTQRLAPGALDDPQRGARLLRLLVDHVPADPRLHGDHAHAVRHHVVQLAGDPQPLLGHRPPGQLALRPHLVLGLRAHRRDIGTLSAHGEAQRPRRAHHGQRGDGLPHGDQVLGTG
jgi:hypothetical protein